MHIMKQKDLDAVLVSVIVTIRALAFPQLGARARD